MITQLIYQVKPSEYFQPTRIWYVEVVPRHFIWPGPLNEPGDRMIAEAIAGGMYRHAVAREQG